MTEKQESNFNEAILKDFEKSKGSPQYQHWLNYASTSNERGDSLVKTIKTFIPSLENKRHLDIGCGYGGACIAFASEGAVSMGIDYDDRLLNFSRVNGQDHPALKVNFKKIDIMNWNQVKSLGKFDIITCDNVIEHVAEPGRLIGLCSELINTDGLIYITVPNAFSIGQIKKDCHYGLFGVSLLDPDDGRTFVRSAINQPTYDVSWYYRYDTFESLFTKYGFSIKLLNPYHITEENIDELYSDYKQLYNEANQWSNTTTIPIEIRQKVLYRLDHHIQMLETDIHFYRDITDPLARATNRNNISEIIKQNYGTLYLSRILYSIQ